MTHEPHPTQQKIDTIQELSDLIARARGLYLADFTGLNVEQANELRSNFHQKQVVYRVFKNTMIRHACQKAGFSELVPYLEGPTALAISFEDPVLPVRLISDFAKGMEKQTPIIKAGMLEKFFVGAQDIAVIKDIPSREILLSQILTSLQAPLANFVGTLNEVLRSFVAVLQAVIDKKQASGGDKGQTE